MNTPTKNTPTKKEKAATDTSLEVSHEANVNEETLSGEFTEDETIAIQASNKSGTKCAVGIFNLHVMIVPDGKYWFAQGLEIDYAVQAQSVEDAKKKFADGLEATVHHHLQIFGDISNLLKVAPNEEWLDLWNTTKKHSLVHSQMSMHKVIKRADILPFANIQFYSQGLAA